VFRLGLSRFAVWLEGEFNLVWTNHCLVDLSRLDLSDKVAVGNLGRARAKAGQDKVEQQEQCEED
jgi:hypothetical protein